MGIAYNPAVVTNGLVLALDAGNQKSLNIPTQADHGYAEWYCLVSGTATYSIINSTGGIIYERNGSTVTSVATASGPQRGTISVTAGRFYYGSVPVNLVVEDQQHSIVPLTMMGTQFWNIAARAGVTPSTYYVYSPYQSATVSFYDGTATGLAGTPTSTLSLSAGQSGTFSSSTNNNHWISSNTPIIASVTQNGADKTVLSPMSTYVYQRFQNYLNTTNNTTPTNNNAYVTYDSTYKVMNMNIADGAGGDCAQGLGLEYLSDTYSWGNVVSDYTIVFPYTATVTTSYWNGSTWVVWDTHTNIAGSITNPPRVTRDGTNGPGIEAGAIQGAAANMATGATLWKWEGTAPFYLCINDSADDEFSVLGWLSARNTTPRSSNIITDISGVGNNGTLANGPVFTLGAVSSLSFDGTDDYVSIPYTSVLAPTSQITFSAWAFLSNWNISGDRRILSKTQGGGYQIGLNEPSFIGDGFLGALLYAGGAYRIVKIARSSISSGWHNLSFTFDGRYFRMYIDNSNVSTYDHGSTTTISYSNNNHFLVGAEPGAGTAVDGAYWNGNIAQVQIYNRALTPSEIQQNFTALRGRFGI